jgi:hypothetical protein
MKFIHIIIFLVLFNFPIKHALGGVSLYYVFVFFAFIYLFFKMTIDNKKVNTSFSPLILYVLLFVVIFVLESLFGLLTNYSIALKSTISMLWVFIFYFLFFNSNSSFQYAEFIRVQIFFAVIVAFLGYLQNYGSRDLWGIIPRIRGDGYYEDMTYAFRTSSILYSAQVFGLYCILNVIILIEYKSFFKKKYYFLILLFIFFAGLLSGNKSVSVIFVFYWLLKFLFKNKSKKVKYVIVGALFLTLTISVLAIYSSESVSRSISWITNSDQIRNNESNGRIKIYSNFFEKSNLFLGYGIGSTVSVKGEESNYVTTESYFLQVFSEGGIVLLLFFLIFVFSTLSRLYKLNDKSFFLLFSSGVFSMAFVHAIASPVFIGFWGCVFFALKKSKRNFVLNYKRV